jgi:hypothetical protein
MTAIVLLKEIFMLSVNPDKSSILEIIPLIRLVKAPDDYTYNPTALKMITGFLTFCLRLIIIQMGSILVIMGLGVYIITLTIFTPLQGGEWLRLFMNSLVMTNIVRVSIVPKVNESIRKARKEISEM